MNHLHDLINRLRAGDSERRIAQDLKMSRPTVHKYKLWAEQQGYLDPGRPLPDLATVLAAWGPIRQPPQMTSSLASYQEFVEQLLDQGVEMTAIWQRLRESHQYQGSYSAVRRFVQRLRPKEAEAFVRVQTKPGEEMQVDFGNAGQLFDPVTGRLRSAYVFVATLGYSPISTPSWFLTRKCQPGWRCIGERLRALAVCPNGWCQTISNRRY